MTLELHNLELTVKEKPNEGEKGTLLVELENLDNTRHGSATIEVNLLDSDKDENLYFLGSKTKQIFEGDTKQYEFIISETDIQNMTFTYDKINISYYVDGNILDGKQKDINLNDSTDDNQDNQNEDGEDNGNSGFGFSDLFGASLSDCSQDELISQFLTLLTNPSEVFDNPNDNMCILTFVFFLIAILIILLVLILLGWFN